MTKFEQLSAKADLCHHAQVNCLAKGKVKASRIWARKKMAIVEKMFSLTIGEAGQNVG